MKLETIKKNHLKRNIIIGVIAVLIISAVVITFTRAKYRVTESIPLVNGTINYTPYDFKVIAMYQENDNGEYDSINTIPVTGYILNETKSYCEINGEKDNNIPMEYKDNRVYIGINKKGTKCYLYFDKTLNGAILADNPTIDNSRSKEITGPLTENITGTLFTDEDDYGTSYLYAGDIDNNWVSFAGYYWRIIRINGDGSIRMIYSGNSESGPVKTGEETQIGTSAFNEQSDDNAYVGYMYGTPGSDTYEETHANINDSTIKTVLDNWYQNNLLNYSEYISTEQGFCNDRQIRTDLSSYYEQYYGILGYGMENTIYDTRFAAGDTIGKDIQNPSLKCNSVNDWFTVNNSNKGNHELNYPVGLITTDELVLAGGFLGHDNLNYYLYTNQYYWTMFPGVFSGGYAYVQTINFNGNIGGMCSNNILGVRPVINLDKNVSISSGNGTSSNPYIIAT